MGNKATMAAPRFCSFEGCGRKHYGNGLCEAHHTQQSRGGELKPIRPYVRTSQARPAVDCSFEGCVKPSRVGGLCSGHRGQKQRGQELRPLRPRRTNGTEEPCSFEGCPNTTTGGAYGLCRGHSRQKRKGQDLKPLPDWNDNMARDSKGRKRCASCREWLTLDSFHRDSHRLDGLTTRCKKCSRNAVLTKQYRMTRAEYVELLESQGGVCAICGASESADGSTLAVDHDHTCCPGSATCGKCIRGLLCRACNQGIGSFADDVSRLRAAIAYLESRTSNLTG